MSDFTERLTNNANDFDGIVMDMLNEIESLKAQQDKKLTSSEPVFFIPEDHLQQAKQAPFHCRVEPTKRRDDFVAIYTTPQPAPTSLEPVVNYAKQNIELEQTGWPLIELGYGLVEVGEGHHEHKPALIFGRNGTGNIGEPTPPNRHLTHEETLAVITFTNVESIDVVLMKLGELRDKMTNNTTPRQHQTPKH